MMKQRISMATKARENKTVQEGFKEFIKSCKVKNLSDKTVIYYEACMDKFQQYLEACEVTLIKDINADLMADFTLYTLS